MAPEGGPPLKISFSMSPPKRLRTNLRTRYAERAAPVSAILRWRLPCKQGRMVLYLPARSGPICAVFSRYTGELLAMVVADTEECAAVSRTRSTSGKFFGETAGTRPRSRCEITLPPPPYTLSIIVSVTEKSYMPARLYVGHEKTPTVFHAAAREKAMSSSISPVWLSMLGVVISPVYDVRIIAEVFLFFSVCISPVFYFMSIIHNCTRACQQCQQKQTKAKTL